MEVISIERSTYEELLTSFNSFVSQMKAMAGRGTDKRLGEWLDNQDVCQILNISPLWGYDLETKFLHQHSIFCVILFLVLLQSSPFCLFLGRIALIFQNPLFFTSFFRNFANKLANLRALGMKNK